MSAQEKDVQTVPMGDGWVNKIGGAQVGPQFPTQEAAITEGRKLASEARVEHVVHGTDGKIREKNSYGNDPREIRG
jgi:hypothetical protein